MNTLAFDTCFGACSVAAFWDGGNASRFELLQKGHAERLMPMIAEVMAEAPFGFAALNRIVVTTGPGTFTGQRVGIAAARALALATGARVGTLSSLAVMAHAAASELGGALQGKILAVAVDARRGEIYFQTFSGAGLAPLLLPMLVTPEAAARLIGTGDALAVGSGAETFAERAHMIGIVVNATLGRLEPDVRHVPPTAASFEDEAPRPAYFRPPDAKPQEGKSLKKVP
jgi:tRNA threonylcarbamoyladenosine biosynthesis protein TsaB